MHGCVLARCKRNGWRSCLCLVAVLASVAVLALLHWVSQQLAQRCAIVTTHVTCIATARPWSDQGLAHLRGILKMLGCLPLLKLQSTDLGEAGDCIVLLRLLIMQCP